MLKATPLSKACRKAPRRSRPLQKKPNHNPLVTMEVITVALFSLPERTARVKGPGYETIVCMTEAIVVFIASENSSLSLNEYD